MLTQRRPAGADIVPQPREDGLGNDTRTQYLWNTPDGARGDFADSYTYGDDIPISWNALNNSIYDLWLTSWTIDRSNPVALRLARAVNLTYDGNLMLVTSNPPTTQLASESQYAFRFKPPTDGQFVPSDPEIASPGFMLVEPLHSHQQNTQPHSTATTSSTPSTTSLSLATSRVDPFWAPSPTPTSTSNSSSRQQMSPAEVAAVIIGIILIVALLVAVEVTYLMWRRKRRREQDAGEAMPSSSSIRTRLRRLGKGGGGDGTGLFIQVREVEKIVDDAPWMSPELPGDSTWGERLVHELQGSRAGSGSGRSGGGKEPPTATSMANNPVAELEARRG